MIRTLPLSDEAMARLRARYSLPQLAADPSATAKDKNPQGGLSAAGRKKFGVAKGVTDYSGASEPDKKRWVRWALRFTKTAQPLKDDKGEPTRYALMFHAWGEPVPTSPAAVAAVHTKALTRRDQLGMGESQKAAEEEFAEWAEWAQWAQLPDAEDAAIHPKPHPGHAAETEVIARNKRSPLARSKHPFHPAAYPSSAGYTRCLICGNTTPQDAMCPGVGGPAATVTEPAPGAVAAPALAAQETVKAFVTEVDGHTLITARADVLVPAEKANAHFLRISGRFVGADTPNRNKAYWSSADLELGQHTVANGPLNWLHEARHVIGTIDKASFHPAAESAADAGPVQPHIQAGAVIWKWIYPDEAYVVQAASEAGKLWYSMECISDTVQCIGDGGCGAEAAYLDYCKGINGTCEHMIQRSGVRRFNNPTFLGGAIIVPPARPGWADADVQVQAAAIAEQAYDQAGRPDMPATEWEQLMAQVLLSATS